MTVTLSVTPTTLQVNQSVTATVSWTAPLNAVSTDQITIAWGDGTSTTIPAPLPLDGSTTASHTYTAAGTFTVVATVYYTLEDLTPISEQSNTVTVTVTAVVAVTKAVVAVGLVAPTVVAGRGR